MTEAYRKWHEFWPHIPKTSRYTLAAKIDSLFVETIEQIVISTYLQKEEKLPCLSRASTKLDLLKFFLQVAWKVKALDNKKYLTISQDLDEIGRMLGGWLRQLKEKLPRQAEV